jgi:hypothetical protein
MKRAIERPITKFTHILGETALGACQRQHRFIMHLGMNVTYHQSIKDIRLGQNSDHH